MRVSLVNFCSALLLSIVAVATFSGPAVGESVDQSMSSDDKAFWIEKAARTLRSGEGIGRSDRMDELMNLPREEIVDRLMADWRFEDTVLAFNLYYLGRGLDYVRDGIRGPKLNAAVWQYPTAVAAANAVASGGDYWKLFDERSVLFASPLKDPYLGVPSTGSDGISIPDADRQRLSEEQRRAVRERHKSDALRKIDQIIAALSLLSGEPDEEAALCRITKRLEEAITGKLAQSGFGLELIETVSGAWLPKVFQYTDPNSGLSVCFGAGLSSRQLLAVAIDLKREVPKLFDLAESLGETNDVITTIGQLKQVHLVTRNLPNFDRTALTYTGFWSRLINSSTNFNRKRAAYVLKTYFCDDLTPISTVGDGLDPNHTRGRHGSDPACQSCHYKLDPIAGLFRYHGAGGANFKDEKNFFFDDGTMLDQAGYFRYLDNWRTSPRDHVVGYFNSPGRIHPQWEGDELSDLWKFLRRAPEVKQCLVRRMAEYFLGPEQVYDGAWLNQLSAELAPGPDSGQAVRTLVKNLVLSNTFSERDPVSGTCYDFPDGVPVGNRPPCAIAHIMEKNCVRCHRSEGEGFNAQKWVEIPSDDQSAARSGFHYIVNGQQLSAVEGFRRILQRISETDPQRRMPRGGSMPAAELQTLYQWLDQETKGQ